MPARLLYDFMIDIYRRCVGLGRGEGLDGWGGGWGGPQRPPVTATGLSAPLPPPLLPLLLLLLSSTYQQPAKPRRGRAGLAYLGIAFLRRLNT